MASKAERIAALTQQINKEAAKKNPDREDPVAFVAAGNEARLEFGLLPTGNLAVDDALGGGFPRGTIAMLIGQEGTGKSCLAFDMIAHNQERDPEFVAIYVHLEARSFPLTVAIRAGVDLDRMIILNALSAAEDSLDIMMRYLFDWKTRTAQNLVDLVVIDSVAAASPETELRMVDKEGLAKDTVGRQAAMMSKVLRVLSGSGAIGKAVLLLINQYRVDITGYGGKATPGGKALGYYPKVTLEMMAPKSGWLKRGPKEAPEVYGHTIELRVAKNNTGIGHPQATASYEVIYGEGVNTLGPLVDIAVKRGIIEQTSTSWYQITRDGATAKVNGREKLEALLADDPELVAWIEAQISGRATGAALATAPATAEAPATA